MEVKTKTNWYVITVQGNREKSVMEKLNWEREKNNAKIDRVIVPTQKKYSLKNGKKVAKEEILYPGYVFIQTTAIGELKYLLKQIKGAGGMVSIKEDPVSLSDVEVRRMIVDYEDNLNKDKVIPFILGEEVTVCDGPFTSFKGSIKQINEDKGKLKVGVMVFGREMLIELDNLQVTK